VSAGPLSSVLPSLAVLALGPTQALPIASACSLVPEPIPKFPFCLAASCSLPERSPQSEAEIPAGGFSRSESLTPNLAPSSSSPMLDDDNDEGHKVAARE